MVFELKINAGYLIVCTFNLNNSPVAGNYLKAQLQDYAKNGKIEKNILPLVPAKLNEIINHKYSSRSILPTDIGFDALGQLKIK